MPSKVNPVAAAAAAAAESLQPCPTLCDPIDGSPPGSSVPGILQALSWDMCNPLREIRHSASNKSYKTSERRETNSKLDLRSPFVCCQGWWGVARGSSSEVDLRVQGDLVHHEMRVY